MNTTSLHYTGLSIVASLALVMSLLIGPQSALANQARHAGMSNNPMVEDDTDIVDFPGMLTAYSDMVFVNLTPPTSGITPGPAAAEGDGNAGALFGRNIGFGVWIHRRPIWRDLDEFENLFDFVSPLPETYDLVDLFFGIKGGFGMRVSFSAGLDSDETRNNEGNLLSTGGSTFVIDMQPGYSFDLDSYHGDFGVGLTFSTFKLILNGTKTYESNAVPSFYFRHRSIIYPRAQFSGIIDVMLTRRAYAMHSLASNKADEIEADMGRWVATLVAGPKLNIPGNVSICLGARFSVEHLHGVVDKLLQPKLNAIGVPGFVASAEVLLWNLMFVRAGVDYDVYWTQTTVPKKDEDSWSGVPGSAGSQDSGQRFGWSTGLGFLLGDFNIDATVSQNLYFSGPDFIGGRAPGFLGLISATYMW